TLHAVLDLAGFARSGGNRLPWRVAVFVDRTFRGRLAAAMQPIWDEYMAAARSGQRAFNAVSYEPPTEIEHTPNDLLDHIDTIPVVLVVAADLRELAVMDAALDRASIVGGASVYPFCWSILLAAHEHGLGGVMTTFLARAEPLVVDDLGLPEHHAIAATIFLGVPEHRATRLTRRPVEDFATLDRFDGPALHG
ncbi:MAG: nitroreductase family protein, partial [Ilumatobacteraceae bacterium]|nr:nitroreductase family protein [Ilumatobacteraceae bacterium]